MKPTFDLTEVYNEGRPLSWSAISSFDWNPKRWHDKYVLKIEEPKSAELVFGSMVDKRIQEDPTFLPDLVRYPVMQHEMRAEFDGIPLIGFADTYRQCVLCNSTEAFIDHDRDACKGFSLRDYKTGRKAWDQKRADETGQLTMYTFMLYLMDKIKPEEVELYIDWLPTHIEEGQIQFIEEGDIRTFKTSRSMHDVLKFGQRIKTVWKAMEEYATKMDNLNEW